MIFVENDVDKRIPKAIEPARAMALKRLSSTILFSLSIKYFIVLNIASPGQRFITPGTIKIIAGYLNILAQYSEIKAITKAETKVAI